MPNKPSEASFTPAQGKRIADCVQDFEAHGRNRGLDGFDLGPNRYKDYWIEITGTSTSGGITVATWKHKLRKSHNTFVDHPDGVTSSSSSPDTRAYYLGVGNPKGICRAIVDIDEYGIITFTIPAGGGNLQTVYLTQTGGADGSQTTAPTWTYTVEDIFLNTIMTSAAPQTNRATNGSFTPATYGQAYQDSSGTWQLLIAYEEPGTDAAACNEVTP